METARVRISVAVPAVELPIVDVKRCWYLISIMRL
jgi:hypothetical protein